MKPSGPDSVVHLTAEYWPLAQTGGLGQAVAGLAAYQARSGLPTTVVMPLYRSAREAAPRLKPFGEAFTVTMNGVGIDVQPMSVPVGRGEPQVVLIDCPQAYDRRGIYGEDGGDYPDNAWRFGFFSLAALQYVARQGGAPIVHAHDWHAALVPVFLRTVLAGRPEFDRLRCVLTVHNGGFHGLFDQGALGVLGLPQWLWSLDWMEWYGRLDFLKGGLKHADMCTTVSPTHAVELCTATGGFGLHEVFRGLGDRLVGIRNGIDELVWDPSTDKEITARFGPDDMAGKVRCKASLQRHWGLTQRAGTPLFGMSARLVAQKGFDLIFGCKSLVEADAQFVFLGDGEARYISALSALAATHPLRIAANFAFTDRKEHRLLAGADFLLMPSLYEPCGLTQMRAQRYGALPLARRVGGLADTIVDDATGILFDGYAPGDLDIAIHRALDVYRDRPLFREHARAAMMQDFTWATPAAQYHEVYRRAMARP
ncbi:MAG: glycogen synthase [Gemmatimonadales bacterium]